MQNTICSVYYAQFLRNWEWLAFKYILYVAMFKEMFYKVNEKINSNLKSIHQSILSSITTEIKQM